MLHAADARTFMPARAGSFKGPGSFHLAASFANLFFSPAAAASIFSFLAWAFKRCSSAAAAASSASALTAVSALEDIDCKMRAAGLK